MWAKTSLSRRSTTVRPGCSRSTGSSSRSWSRSSGSPELLPFFEEFYLQLKLFGYVIFRKKKFGVQVLSGLDAVLSRDPKTFKIVPVFKSTFAKTRGWHLVVAKMPRFSSSGSQLSTGAGLASLEAALEIIEINTNAIERDTINSRPTIYTRVSQQLKASGSRPDPGSTPCTRRWYRRPSPGRWTSTRSSGPGARPCSGSMT